MNFYILKTDISYLRNYLHKIINVDQVVEWYMAKKGDCLPILVKDIPTHVSLILKQEMLSIGSDAAISSNSIMERKEKEHVLLMGKPHIYKKLMEKLKQQPFGLSQLGKDIYKAIKNYEKFYQTKTKLMGILNITPDSFYDGGKYIEKESLLKRIDELNHYADIIDVGSESSRPGSKRITAKEEIKRLEPFFSMYKGHLPISLDTYKFEVFKKFSNRVNFLNDITAISDNQFYDFLPNTNHKIIIMHMKGTPKTMQKNPYYDDVIEELLLFFDKKIEKLVKNGISEDRIIIDPGIGFGKRFEDNIRILKEIDAFKQFGVEILIGHSNKSFLKEILQNKYEILRNEGTKAVSSYLIGKKINYIRVHDVISHRAIINTYNFL